MGNHDISPQCKGIAYNIPEKRTETFPQAQQVIFLDNDMIEEYFPLACIIINSFMTVLCPAPFSPMIIFHKFSFFGNCEPPQAVYKASQSVNYCYPAPCRDAAK
jgi:hypothetical protein